MKNFVRDTPRALPRRFRRPRAVILGCGDIGLRMLRLSHPHVHWIAVARHCNQQTAIRLQGAHFLMGDLNVARFRQRVCSLGRRILMLAPPADTDSEGRLCRRLAWAICRLGAPKPPLSITYVSTTGVYGDHGGAVVTELTPVAPISARAQRRVAAEAEWLSIARGGRARVRILRAPGIYAHDRLPLQRLHDGKPVICAPEDSFSNHIHALDLARLCFAAAFRDKAPRIVNAVDEEPMKMGDFFDCVAQYAGLPKPPRLPKEAVRAMVSPALWSFMCESRRIVSLRRSALLSSLRYPCVELALPPNQKS